MSVCYIIGKYYGMLSLYDAYHVRIQRFIHAESTLHLQRESAYCAAYAALHWRCIFSVKQRNCAANMQIVLHKQRDSSVNLNNWNRCIDAAEPRCTTLNNAEVALPPL